MYSHKNRLSVSNSVKTDVYNVSAIMYFEFLRDLQVTTEMKFKHQLMLNNNILGHT